MSRLRQRLGPVTVHVRPDRVNFDDGRVFMKDYYGAPLTARSAIAVAGRNMHQGDVCAIADADYDQLAVCGANPGHPENMAWPNAQPIKNIAFVAEDEANPPRIRGLSILGQIDKLTFCGIRVSNHENPPDANHPTGSSSETPIIVAAGLRIAGSLRLWDLTSEAVRPGMGDWNGYDMKWGLIRNQGNLDYLEIMECLYWNALEHGLCYGDAVGWKTKRGAKLFRNKPNPRSTKDHCGRTLVQICSRADTTDPVLHAGPPGQGPIHIDGLDGKVANFDGGYAITSAGHLGVWTVENVSLECRDSHGALCFWSDQGHGSHFSPDGYTCLGAVLRNVTARGVGNKNPLAAIAGVRNVTIEDFDFATQNPLGGGATAFDLNNAFGGGVDNGLVVFNTPGQLSAYSGFGAGVATKVRKNGQPVPANMLDAMNVWEPSTHP